MTAVIAPVVPSARTFSSPSARRAVGSNRPVPLARLAPGRIRSVTYGLSTLDRHGRVGDRSVLAVLGWRPGTRVDLREDRGLVLATGSEDGAVRVTGRGHLRLPVSLRRFCGLAAGDRVLLVADPSDGLLVLYPPSALDAMVSGFHAFLTGGERP